MSLCIRTLVACGVVAFAASSFAAEDTQDVVTGSSSKEPLRSAAFGNCVHTKWSTASDPCAPAPVAAAPVVPAPMAPPPQPVMQLGHEQLTIYFPFNKYVITPESESKLDAIADAVNRSPKVTKVDIVGYTDQIGTPSYNDKLSVKRAKATKGYLDTKMRIPANVLDLRGMGEKDPVVMCKKAKGRKAKIACMAKNRRVEIEFEFEK